MDRDQLEKELNLLSDEGLIDEEDVSSIRERAVGAGKDPISLLHQDGMLSSDTLIFLRGRLQENPPTLDETLTPNSLNKPRNKAETPSPYNPPNYRLVRLLGKGGMGRVYEAIDTRLNRRVAIKFLIGDEPEQLERFAREALAQAHVDHENLCKVYEVGETDGHPFIVMQYIEGQPLKEFSHDMSVEQKILVMKKVTEGIQEAHRMGLIHRDIKPGNIILSRGEAGEWKPFVLDFGLARFGAEGTLTVSGDILGTPDFMSPEQARGELENLDRRTDVYGLGATLYYLLLGKAPFAGSSVSAVLVNILSAEPTRPRQIRPAIPKDVETIVLKCLEKQQENRYDSARALAEDLGRYLEGEPLVARPPGWWYPIAKKIRKYRAAVSVAIAAVLLLILSLGWGAWRTSERERLSRLLTRHVEEIEALARLSHLSRRHDIRPDRERLRAHMDAIRKEMNKGGKWGRAAANYALGQGYLEQQSFEKSLNHLRRAWDSGYREPRVAYALGRAYSALYSRQLDEALVLANGPVRERHEAEARERYREPALFFMAQAQNSEIEQPAYLQAMIASFDGRYQDALQHLVETKQHVPWFYEAHKLEADLYKGWALSNSRQGELEEARRNFARSIEGYERAAQIAESDPEIYRAKSHALLLMMHIDMFSAEDLASYLEQGLKSLDWALEILPDDRYSLQLQAQLYRLAAKRDILAGRDPKGNLELAEQASHLAIEKGAEPSLINLELGGIYWQWAEWLADHRQASDKMVDRAIEALDKVAPENRGYPYFYMLGSALKCQARDVQRKGGDPAPAYKRAIEIFREAVKLNPEQIACYNSLAQCLYALADEESTENPTLYLEEAVVYLEKAFTFQDNHLALHYQLGRTLLRLAQGESPTSGKLDVATADKAISHFQQAIEINPKIANLYNPASRAWGLRAQHAWANGESPEPQFEKAIALCRQGLEHFPDSWRMKQYLANNYYFRGKFRVRAGSDPSGDLKRAIQLCKESLAKTPWSETNVVLGSSHRLLAEHMLNQGQDPSEHIAQAHHAFQAILQGNPNHREAHRSLGRLYTLEAQWRVQTNQDPSIAFSQARFSLDKSYELSPQPFYVLLADARWHLHYTAWKKGRGELIDPSLLTARKELYRELGKWTHVPEAMIARACFHEAAEQSKTEMSLALEANPHLAFEWKPLSSF